MRADARRTRRWFRVVHKPWNHTESSACSACIFLHLRLSLSFATCGNGGRYVDALHKVAMFDGHNDAVQHLAEYRAGGRDFLVRSDDGHLDLPRAREGGMIGGLFAMFAKPERPPVGDLTKTATGTRCAWRSRSTRRMRAERIDAQLDALQSRGGARRGADPLGNDGGRDRGGAARRRLRDRAAHGGRRGDRCRSGESRSAVCGGIALARSGVESPEHLRAWCAVCISAVAGHRARTYRRGQGVGARVQSARDHDRCVAFQ